MRPELGPRTSCPPFAQGPRQERQKPWSLEWRMLWKSLALSTTITEGSRSAADLPHTSCTLRIRLAHLPAGPLTRAKQDLSDSPPNQRDSPACHCTCCVSTTFVWCTQTQTEYPASATRRPGKGSGRGAIRLPSDGGETYCKLVHRISLSRPMPACSSQKRDDSNKTLQRKYQGSNMADRHNFNGPPSDFSSGFQDPVFEPSPDFNFEDDASNMMMTEGFGDAAGFPL